MTIGVDFFQTLAIASSAKVPWPPVIRDFFRIMSAFNLNIEILAPECLLPNVTFVSKFSAVIAMPLLIYIFLGILFSLNFAYRRYVKAQTNWKLLLADAPVLLSSGLLLFYLFYLYVARTVFDVFTCVPSEPPDGNLYLISAGVEGDPCGTPGGTQAVLLPWALLALFLYVLGYPAGVAWALRRYKELIMEDQLIRAKGVGFDRLSNPNAYDVRLAFSRVYYMFKPTHYYWVLVVLLRKLCLSICALIFSRNVAFQLAAALIIMFLAYAGAWAGSVLHPLFAPNSHKVVFVLTCTVNPPRPILCSTNALLAIHVQ